MGDSILPDELRAVFRLSLSPNSELYRALKDPFDNSSPATTPLKLALLFSRRFVLTYYVVLVGAIVTYSAFHWHHKAGGKRRKAEKERNLSALTSISSSSSSTTLQGSEDEHAKPAVQNEETPLIGHSNEAKGLSQRVKRLRCRIKAGLLYQPKPRPAITSPRNLLPENLTTICVTLLVALNVFYLFFNVSFSKHMIFAFADRAGLIFVVNLPILYILGAKNNQPLKWLTGWSYEGLNIFHRRLGETMTLVAIVHTFGMVYVWWTILRPFGLTFGRFLIIPLVTFGLIAFFMYLAIWITSIGYVRKQLYEMFLASHIFFQVGALVFLFLHHPNTRPYVGAASGIWLIDRLVCRILVSTKDFVASLQIAPDGETVLMFCDIPLNKTTRGGIGSGWLAGQHIFISVPGIQWHHRFQNHPFTIASPAPPTTMSSGTWQLQLTIRAQDGFSRDLLNYARLHQHTKVFIDGPYGGTDVMVSVQQSDRICLVAGGSGIAVTYPLAWLSQVKSEVMDGLISTRIVYKNGVRQIPNIVRNRLPVDRDNFAHMWIRQESNHEHWITALPRYETIIRSETGEFLGSSAENTADLITHRYDTRNGLAHERPDVSGEIEDWVRGSANRAMIKKDSICIVVSGPDGLVRDVRNSAASLIKEGWNIQLHVEKFGW